MLISFKIICDYSDIVEIQPDETISEWENEQNYLLREPKFMKYYDSSKNSTNFIEEMNDGIAF